ncbi:endonuclease domain-containing protein [Microbacterium sp. W1N]|uniref:endonuclease domain-containing protein n=1 Tax=Microbacterium festucae TaxID=2977531 RepID=UPI0021BE6717|nr:endonuclease domain-containing protein [Microbacterium festucae]MCT9818821.1 endonuclease domain-containing protein [Microbacterium festucae]
MSLVSVPADLVLRRADLLALGFRPKQITRAVRGGRILRLRRDRYLAAPQPGIESAVRVGGRLACVSLLRLLGVFVFDDGVLHIHIERTMSRLRSPADRTRPLSDRDRAALRLHWWPLRFDEHTLGVVPVADAVAQAVRCQSPRHAVATIDSILHHGILTRLDLADVFAALPRRFGTVLRLSDGRAESGPETLMRLILRQLGLRFEVQVQVDGVGRVDFLVEGWLIIECDSKAHHEGWRMQKRDRRRDLAAARLGLVSLRPLAEDLLYDPERVIAAVRGLVATRRR